MLKKKNYKNFLKNHSIYSKSLLSQNEKKMSKSFENYINSIEKFSKPKKKKKNENKKK